MAEHKIDPHKVTKPIQLLAAWLVGLVLVDAMFLATALQLEAGWERGCLIGFAIFNVPLFLAAIFILQTKFRAELQEDTYYADYLSKKTALTVKVSPAKVLSADIRALEEQLSTTSVRIIAVNDEAKGEQVAAPIKLDWSDWRIALNDFHPRFKEIREALRAEQIPLAEIFGDLKIPSSKPPGRWIVAINRSMPVAHKFALLKLALRFDFDGYQIWRPLEDVGETEDVYFGSYGEATYVTITPELGTLIDEGAEEADLHHYSRKHRVGSERSSEDN